MSIWILMLKKDAYHLRSITILARACQQSVYRDDSHLKINFEVLN